LSVRGERSSFPFTVDQELNLLTLENTKPKINKRSRFHIDKLRTGE